MLQRIEHRRAASRSPRVRQRGVVAIEFALMFLFGLLPLLLLTFTGVLIFAAKQSLTLAAADGARAALRFQPTVAERHETAIAVAAERMQWLLDFADATPESAIVVSDEDCADASAGAANVTCIKVTTSYDYDNHPFLPGTVTAYGWVLGGPLQGTATVQIEAGT
jgi:Flp pilus assembly protein TadG